MLPGDGKFPRRILSCNEDIVNQLLRMREVLPSGYFDIRINEKGFQGRVLTILFANVCLVLNYVDESLRSQLFTVAVSGLTW